MKHFLPKADFMRICITVNFDKASKRRIYKKGECFMRSLAIEREFGSGGREIGFR